MRKPVHQNGRGRRRASADRAAQALRRRRAARQRHDSNSLRVAAHAGKFRAPQAKGEVRTAPPPVQAAVFLRRELLAPANQYLVLYLALAVTSVLAAAMAFTPSHNGGWRAHPWLVALSPKGISRVVPAPQMTALREVELRDVADQASAPPLAGLSALRETIQSRQVDDWVERETAPLNRKRDLAAVDDVSSHEQQDAAASPAIIDDEFGSGLKFPGICELPDGARSNSASDPVAASEVQREQDLRSPNSAARVQPAEFGVALATAAQRQTSKFTVYTDKYRRMAYPMGDVPALFGVCTDVVIRAYRALGVDLQALIHIAKIGPADSSIAHRRTFTLRRYFASRGASVPISEFAEDYRAGDIVTYHRPQNRGSRDHIAIVSNLIAPSGRPMIVHNRGWGPQLEDALFVDKITGHYRFAGPEDGTLAGAAAKPAPNLIGAKRPIKASRPRAAALKAEARSRSSRPEAPSERR